MRGLFFLLFGIVFFAYAVTRPADPKPTNASLADLPAAYVASDLPKAKTPSQPPQMVRLSSTESHFRETSLPKANVATLAPQRTQPSNAEAGQVAVGKSETAPSSPTKRTAEVLTGAAIAALIVAESRRAYYTRGRPCACPDDRMRNGRSCGSRSAYSRPGGATPLCYPADVTAVMIKNHRAQVAQR